MLGGQSIEAEGVEVGQTVDGHGGVGCLPRVGAPRRESFDHVEVADDAVAISRGHDDAAAMGVTRAADLDVAT